MRDAITQAKDRLTAIYYEGIENCRRGRPDRLFSSPVTGSVSLRYQEAYDTWMQLRAQGGDRFALFLGYGKQVEAR